MIERREIIFCSKEIREAVQEADRIRCPQERERRLKELGIDEIRPLHPNEIVIEKYEYDNGLGRIERRREIKIDPRKRAGEWFDAICIACLPSWIDQLRALGVKDSGYWQMVAKEREAKRNE